MTRQSFEQRIVVMRVLIRYATAYTQIDWNDPVVAALEKWIQEDRDQACFGRLPDVRHTGLRRELGLHAALVGRRTVNITDVTTDAAPNEFTLENVAVKVKG